MNAEIERLQEELKVVIDANKEFESRLFQVSANLKVAEAHAKECHDNAVLYTSRQNEALRDLTKEKLAHEKTKSENKGLMTRFKNYAELIERQKNKGKS